MNNYGLSLDYKEQKEWSKPQMWLEMAIGAIAGGLFITSLIFKFSLGAIIAVLLMLLGKGLLLLSDLGRPERMLNIFSRPKDSWISKGAWGLILFGVTSAVSVAPLVLPGLSWLPWGGGGKILGIIAGVLAAFMMTYDAYFLSESKGVEFWNNGGLPMVFLTSAAVGGIGAFMVLAPFSGLAVGTGTLAFINTAILAATGISLYSYLRSAASGSEGSQVSMQLLMKGRISPVFKTGVVGAGIVVPLCVSIAAALFGWMPSMAWQIIGILEIVGVVFLRYSILNAGVYSPQA
ncbi:polysulfide reductase NrfD [Dehalobacter sp. DCM]|uniref:NrfD/PsrC family molybdoenzyme membrane anchor subunit n=1 Tax=Dehalobacter sp. DCM TaxID=2907827 RepID=UPI003081D820|nr:polysulfide reductase NrfD [Dehalobacter sp. DCM]